MPFAIEPIVKPTLDIPAPIVSVPTAGDRAASSSSFQDHLDRAGRTNDGPAANSSSTSNADRNAPADAKADIEARRRDEAGDRAEADRRNETTDTSTPASESTAPKADDTKLKPAHGEAKVEGKKPKGEHDKKDEQKQGDGAAVVAVAATAGTQDAQVKDEATLSADDEAALQAAKTAIDATTPADGKQKEQGAPIDPTKGIPAKEKGKTDAEPKTVAKADQAAVAVAEAQAKDDASAKDGAATAAEAPAVPLMSELHSTQATTKDEKKPKAQAEFAAATKTTATDGATGDAVAAAEATTEKSTSEKPATEPVVAGPEPVAAPEKGTAKPDGTSSKNAEPNFAAQLQGAAEAAAATAPQTTIGSVVDTTAVADASTSTPTVAASTTDGTTKNATTKTTDAPLTATDALRSNSTKEATPGRVLGEEGRQADGLSTVDRARLVQRVARAIRTTQERGGELQIRLSPPELGQLRLQVQMNNGALSARIEAESPQAQQVITDNLNVLRERLAEQNVRVERIDVELMNTGNGGSPNTPDRRNDFSHDAPTPRGFGSASRNGSSGDAAAVEASAPSTSTAGPGRLNVVI